jgi:F-type H+-transporting ATPase subunit epsilon
MLLEYHQAKLFSAEVTSVTLPGVDGSFQILNNHAQLYLF